MSHPDPIATAIKTIESTEFVKRIIEAKAAQQKCFSRGKLLEPEELAGILKLDLSVIELIASWTASFGIACIAEQNLRAHFAAEKSAQKGARH